MRLAAALVAWVLVAASQPGLGRPAGFGHFAFVALAPWGLVCCRPGRRAFLAEWLAATVGLVLLTAWMRHLLPWLVPLLGLVPGLYVAAGGILLRRLAVRFPLAVAVPAAWTAAELVRWHLPAPLSFGWWRLGTFAHDVEWMVGSARVWGTWGLTWVFAAFGGWLADLWRTRGLAPDEEPPFAMALVHVTGVGPLALALLFTGLVRPPATEPGPRVLLVQPGIEQRLKAEAREPVAELFGDAAALTFEGLEEAGAPPDLVCWGETMFPFPLVTDAVVEAFLAGARPMASAGQRLDEGALAAWWSATRSLIGGALLGREDLLPAGRGRWLAALRELAAREPAPWLDRALSGRGILPPGTSFLTGIRALTVRGDGLRTRNAAALFGPGGELAGSASKVHLVPVAEDAERYAAVPFVVEALRAVGGFVPDFVADGEAGTLELATRDGRRYRMGLSVCYDNVFDDPYLTPLAGAGVDFFVVLSNEAWYGRSVEMDHMVAFSRVTAVATGRSVVRATNSGVSVVIDPTGRERAVVRDADGRRKVVRGTLAAVVPVPSRSPGSPPPRTPWARSGAWQPWLWAALVALLALAARRPRNPV